MECILYVLVTIWSSTIFLLFCFVFWPITLPALGFWKIGFHTSGPAKKRTPGIFTTIFHSRNLLIISKKRSLLQNRAANMTFYRFKKCATIMFFFFYTSGVSFTTRLRLVVKELLTSQSSPQIKTLYLPVPNVSLENEIAPKKATLSFTGSDHMG